jgi:hypothetical protein
VIIFGCKIKELSHCPHKNGGKMRKRTVAQRLLFDQAIDALRSVFKPEKKLTALDKIIADNPGIVQAIHADITKQVRKTRS